MKASFLLSFVLLFSSVTISFSQTNERIFYASFCPQDWDIYVSRNAGKTVEQFTHHPSLDYDAAISPDGKWIVFTSERSGIPQLYAKPVDGNTSPVLLFRSNSFQDQAAFSPDGKKLAFVASHEGNAEIYILPFRPDTIQQLSTARNVTNHRGGDFRPAFSPDGKQIAFSSDRDHKIIPHPFFPFARHRTGDIYITEIEGETTKRLTHSTAWDGSPSWSTDGSKILFYSAREGQNALFEMNADGTNQQRILAFEGPVVSPKMLTNGNFMFTTWNHQADFKIMQANPASNKVTPMFQNGPDLMFNPAIHPDGIVAFHGGYAAQNTGERGRFGFNGDVIVKLPDTLTVGGKPLQIYGVRRDIMAPPVKGSTQIVYNAYDDSGIADFLRPLAYGVFILPALVVVLFLTGIVFAIINRKVIPFWKPVLFSFLCVGLGFALGYLFQFIYAIQPKSIPIIRLIMASLMLVTFGISWWFYCQRAKYKSLEKPVYRLSGLYSILFLGFSVFSLYCAVFIHQFMYSTLHFYQVDYLTGEKKELFTFEKEPHTNPSCFNVLDSKVSHDGKAFIFTTGSFRSKAHGQGDIWKYEFASGKIKKLSDSPDNDGFADISENEKMVFRSGRSGHFDIWLKTDRETINLTNDEHRDNFPAISRQGNKIVFASDRLTRNNEFQTMDIFLMELDSNGHWSKPEKISVGEGQHAHPHFSPNGNWVIYTTESYGINDEQALIQPIIFSPQMYGEIVAYNLKTKEHVRLTHNKWEDGTPLWVE